jgi:hypothetical protein
VMARARPVRASRMVSFFVNMGLVPLDPFVSVSVG